MKRFFAEPERNREQQKKHPNDQLLTLIRGKAASMFF